MTTEQPIKVNNRLYTYHGFTIRRTKGSTDRQHASWAIDYDGELNIRFASTKHDAFYCLGSDFQRSTLLERIESDKRYNERFSN